MTPELRTSITKLCIRFYAYRTALDAYRKAMDANDTEKITSTINELALWSIHLEEIQRVLDVEIIPRMAFSELAVKLKVDAI